MTKIEIDDFLRRVHNLDETGYIHKAGDLVFDTVNGLLTSGDFKSCDSILDRVLIERMSVTLILVFLSTTIRAGSKLANREEFFRDAWAEVVLRRGLESADRLLAHLRTTDV